jgi:RING finger and CHY zinc finger domain-containing protein 1
MSELRQNIIEINSRNDIDQQTKSQLIFELMNPNFNNQQQQELEPCTHYKRKCDLKCEDCGKFYPCRICHDENEDHALNRSKVTQIRCRECDFVQNKGQMCLNCGIEFARYFCYECTLYDDEECKKITHCDFCGICRLGETIHCTICDMCFTKDNFVNHQCNGRFDGDCPICGESLKTSRKETVILPCKHTIHSDCHKKNLENGNYQCPLCKKSVGNMEGLWEQIKLYVDNTEMPDEYKNTKARIYCNDCEDKTLTNFHFAYHKCSSCESWNTNIIETFKEPEDSEDLD